MRRILILAVILIAVVAVMTTGLFLYLQNSKPQIIETGPITLTYWGVFERDYDIQPFIEEFQEQNPDIKINYELRSLNNYRSQIESRAGLEGGPDLFRFHNSWGRSIAQVAAIVPTDVARRIDFSNSFYPVVWSDMLRGTTGYFGIPLMYDGLGLFYNRQILREANVMAPPASWEELFGINGVGNKLVGRNSSNRSLEIGAIALGTTSNVDHWQDIFGLMMYQANANLALPHSTRENTESAKRIFRQAIEEELWSSQMPSAINAFAEGRLALMFGVSWRAFDIQKLNPRLDFAVAPVPQLAGSKVGYASYWIEGVANYNKAVTQGRFSRAQAERRQVAAWKFLEFMHEKERVVRHHAVQAERRLFGEPFARKDLAGNLSENRYLAGILETAEQAKSWYLADKVLSGSYNEELSKAYESYLNNAIDTQKLEQQVQQILKKIPQYK
jgi:ABC-type glycerol-3-phosphate transport system substrate-binding protein